MEDLLWSSEERSLLNENLLNIKFYRVYSMQKDKIYLYIPEKVFFYKFPIEGLL